MGHDQSLRYFDHQHFDAESHADERFGRADFERTKRWLEVSEENTFSLVIDELHGYRGTQGSEVSLLARNFWPDWVWSQIQISFGY